MRRIRIAPRIVVYDNGKVRCPIVCKRCVKNYGVPATLYHRHLSAEHKVGLRHVNPVRVAPEFRLVGMDHVDVIAAGLRPARVEVGDAADDIGPAYLLRRVYLL